MGGAHFFHLDEIPTMYGIVNVVAVVRIERQQHIAQGGHSNELTVSLDNRNGPTMAIEHLDHDGSDSVRLLGCHDTSGHDVMNAHRHLPFW